MVGVFLVVEGHAGADDVEDGDAFVGKSRLEQFLDLFGVSREGARHKGCVRSDGFHANIDRHVLVDALLLQAQAHLGGGRELALGQPIDTVVFDNVDHVHVAAHQVLELAHANAGAVAIARDADALQGQVAEQGAGSQRGHAPMQAVEAKGAVQEISR